MEYILNSTDIFDEKLDELFKQKVISDFNGFIPGKPYKLTVTFDVSLLHDKRFDECVVPEPHKQSKRTRVDNINDLLSYQLGKIENVMKDNTIEVYSTKIQGDELNEARIIKIEIEEDLSTPMFRGKGKNKKRMGVSVIMPSRPYITKIGSDFMGKRLGEIYAKLINLVQDKKLMSRILEIDETEDDQLIISAFIDQYGELWLSQEDRTEKLWERLRERTLTVFREQKAMIGESDVAWEPIESGLQQMKLF